MSLIPLFQTAKPIKTLESFEKIMTFLLDNNYGRDVTLLALGGGVIGDITGFVAATYQRGVPFIQVPTTLLSQVDSSVGGKTAVNHPLGKNMIGAFYQPQAVVIDIDTMSTLPEREFAAGMAEVIKYGILGDEAFLEYIQNNAAAIAEKQPEILTYVIRQCCNNKAEIVAQDEKEAGLRALLNLGHTFGHAIEAEMGYGQWLHGEAVSAGMVQACQLAAVRGWLSQQQVDEMIELLAYFKLPVAGPENMTFEQYIPHMRKDKKVQADKIRFVLPKKLGQAILVTDVTESETKTNFIMTSLGSHFYFPPSRLNFIATMQSQLETGRVVAVEGPSGSGKTVVLEELLTSALANANKCYVTAGKQINDIQLRSRVIEQLFGNVLFDPEKPLISSFLEFNQHTELLIVIDNAHFLSGQVIGELLQLYSELNSAGIILGVCDIV